jgi:hypothetical protein
METYGLSSLNTKMYKIGSNKSRRLACPRLEINGGSSRMKRALSKVVFSLLQEKQANPKRNTPASGAEKSIYTLSGVQKLPKDQHLKP